MDENSENPQPKPDLVPQLTHQHSVISPLSTSVDTAQPVSPSVTPPTTDIAITPVVTSAPVPVTTPAVTMPEEPTLQAAIASPVPVVVAFEEPVPSPVATPVVSVGVTPIVSQPVAPSSVPADEMRGKTLLSAFKSKRLIPILIVVAILGAGGTTLALFKDDVRNLLGGVKFTATNSSSVLSLLPPLQEGPVSADVTISTASSTDSSKAVEYSGTLRSESDGKVGVKLIQNVDKVNSLVDYLVSKGESQASGYEKTSEYFSYDYSDLLGYSSIYFDSTRTFFGNQIQKAKVAQNASDKESADSSYIKSQSCQGAIDSAEASTAITSKTLAAKTHTSSDGKFIVTFNNSAIDTANEAMTKFFDSCMDTTKPSLIENDDFVKRIKEKPATLPTVTYKSTPEGTWELTLKGEGKDAILLTFVVRNIRSVENKSVTTKPYTDMINVFGLAYDTCRVPPTVLSDFGNSYNFFAEDTSYRYPNEFNSGYVCAPSEAYGYHPPISIHMDNASFSAAISSSADIRVLETVPEARAYAERVFVQTSAYPGLKEIIAKHEGFSDRRAEVQQFFDSGKLSYELLPNGCIEKCEDFSLTTKLSDRASTVAYSYNHE